MARPAPDARAVVAFVIGLLGVVLFLPPLGRRALLMGASTRSRIESGRGAIGGRGLATAAMVLGAISTALLGLFALLTPAGIARALWG